MEWIPVKTASPSHPKIAGLSDRAFRVIYSAWLYAGLHETSGAIPQAAARELRVTVRVQAELEQAGLWQRNGSGWVIHDWGDHQADVDALRRGRELARKRKQRERDRKREAAG